MQIPVDIGYAAVIRRLARHEIPQLIAASASGRIAAQPIATAKHETLADTLFLRHVDRPAARRTLRDAVAF